MLQSGVVGYRLAPFLVVARRVVAQLEVVSASFLPEFAFHLQVLLVGENINWVHNLHLSFLHFVISKENVGCSGVFDYDLFLSLLLCLVQVHFLHS